MVFELRFKDAESAGKNVKVLVFLIENLVFVVLVIFDRIGELCLVLFLHSFIQLVLLIKD